MVAWADTHIHRKVPAVDACTHQHVPLCCTADIPACDWNTCTVGVEDGNVQCFDKPAPALNDTAGILCNCSTPGYVWTQQDGCQGEAANRLVLQCGFPKLPFLKVKVASGFSLASGRLQSNRMLSHICSPGTFPAWHAFAYLCLGQLTSLVAPNNCGAN